MNNTNNIPEPKPKQDLPPELQTTDDKKATLPDILTIITGLIFIFGIAIAMIIIPDKEFSEQENRSLQQFPVLSDESFLDNLVGGKFTKEMSKYYSDQFPFRDVFVGLKGAAEIGLLKGENNDVILGKKNYLITKASDINKNINNAVVITPAGDTAEPEYITVIDRLGKNIDYISEFADVMNAMGKIPVTVAAAGRSVDALSIYLPPAYPRDNSNILWERFNGFADYAKNIKRLNLLEPLKKIIDKQEEQLYYKTDHHWTTLGAYYAYVEIMKSFAKDKSFDKEFEPLPLSAFEQVPAADDFYGTTWSKAGMKWIEADTIYFFRYDGDEDFVMTIKDGGKTFNGFYDETYLETKDKYSAFLSGNNSRVDIINPNKPNRPKLLLIKDSFAHSVVPFLAYHYDLVILDPRYYRDSFASLVLKEEIDRVLFLHNMQNLSEDDTYGGLMLEAEKALRAYEASQYPVKNIFINGNPINDYVIVYPVEENEKRQHGTAAETLRDMILEKTGIELEISEAVDPEDLLSRDKVIAFTRDGLPENNLIQIATEGNNLVFRCNIGDDASSYAVDIFIGKYLKKAAGSFNFGENFLYADLGGDSFIMIMPPAD